jgi:pyrroloquinoline quinone biosynthesis protein B
VRVRVLGSAAGGGFPQWNCRCGTCEAAREGTRALPRTQSSLAIRGDEGPWFLVNASPDARQQMETLTPDRVGAVRAPPVAGVVLTDAEIDHTAGLLLLRESGAPVRVYGSAAVAHALRDTIVRMLERFCGVAWQTLEPGRTLAIEGSSLVVEPFGTGDDEAIGLVVRDSTGGGVLTYAPGLAALDDAVLARFAASDLVLVDGTFWREDELALLGISQRSAHDMGHVPLSGPGGTLEALGALDGPRRVLVHINNTNPILLEDSPEREAVVRAGVEVAHDGLEITLPAHAPDTRPPGGEAAWA